MSHFFLKNILRFLRINMVTFNKKLTVLLCSSYVVWSDLSISGEFFKIGRQLFELLTVKVGRSKIAVWPHLRFHPRWLYMRLINNFYERFWYWNKVYQLFSFERAIIQIMIFHLKWLIQPPINKAILHYLVIGKKCKLQHHIM